MQIEIPKYCAGCMYNVLKKISQLSISAAKTLNRFGRSRSWKIFMQNAEKFIKNGSWKSLQIDTDDVGVLNPAIQVGWNVI